MPAVAAAVDTSYIGTATNGYSLKVFDELTSCLQRCWSEGVFLHQLAHRFWKLTLQVSVCVCVCVNSLVSLQLLLRVGVWLRNTLDSKVSDM